MKKIYLLCLLFLSFFLTCPVFSVFASELDQTAATSATDTGLIETPDQTPDQDDAAASPDDTLDQSDLLAMCAYYLEQINTYEFGTKEYQDAVLLYLQAYQDALAKLDALASVSASLTDISASVKGSAVRLTDISEINKKEYTLLSKMYDLLDQALSDDVVADEEVLSIEQAAQAELDFRQALFDAVKQINDTLVSQNSLLEDQIDLLKEYLSTVSGNGLDTVSENDNGSIITKPFDEYTVEEQFLAFLVLLVILVLIILVIPVI